MRRPSSVFRNPCLYTLSLCLAFMAAGALAQGQTFTEGPYASLTNTHRSFTNFNVEVVRGMAIDDASKMYAVNAYQSTLLHFAPNFFTLADTWRTLANPVSVATYQGDVYVVGQGNHALARHDGATGDILDVLMLPSEPADLVVDHENAVAYVSCMGADVVVQVALPSAGSSTPLAINKVWGWGEGLLLKRPRFLYLDLGNPTDATDNYVYVAPLVSGNNTLVTRQSGALGLDAKILDGTDTALFPNGALPDHDLFRIHPFAAGGQSEVEPVVHQAGSIILGHGRDPATGNYWILTVRERNADADKQGEPNARGVFADNVAAIVDAANFPGLGSPSVAPDHTVDLDDADPATNDSPGLPATYNTPDSVPFPYALEFLGTGSVVVASSMNPVLSLVDSAGDRLATPIPLRNSSGTIAGEVARTLRWVAPYFLVYCQQTSNILVFLNNGGLAEPILSISLGGDPTPESVDRGRAIWYDASLSKDGRTSCNTCHPQGGADALVWDIGNIPIDDKGPMVTQPLAGINDSFPHHWRGENELADFNVFEQLLGGTGANLDTDELDDFMDFIYSLEPHANPRQTGVLALDAQGRLVQDFDRQLKASLTPYTQGVDVQGIVVPGTPNPPLVGNPVKGSSDYHTENSDAFDGGGANLGACVNCHTDPTGSNGEFNTDDFTLSPLGNNFEVAHLDNQLPLKNQPLVNVDLQGTNIVSNLLGTGTAHDGRQVNPFDFVNNLFRNTLTDQVRSDIAAFQDVFDHGMAPSVHYGAKLDENSPPGTATDIQRWLLDQAELDPAWVGVVVVGRFPAAGQLERLHWYYDASTRLFVSDNPALTGPQPFSAFQDFTGALKPSNVFLGVPPGNEARLGVDWDDDELDTAGEATAGTSPYVKDYDGDTFPDGYEVAHGSDPKNASSTPSESSRPFSRNLRLDFVNASQAKFTFESTEPVKWTMSASTANGPTVMAASRNYEKVHTAVLLKLLPSTIFNDQDGDTLPDHVNSYLPTLTMTDMNGNSSFPMAMLPFDTTSLLRFDMAGLDEPDRELTVVGRITHMPLTGDPSFDHRVRVRMDFREDVPLNPRAPDQVVVGQLLKEVPGTSNWQVVPPADVTHNAPAEDVWVSGPTMGGGTFTDGPFLVLPPTNANGWATVKFRVANVSPGEKLLFNVLAAIPTRISLIQPYDPAQPAFDVNAAGNNFTFNAYQMPATKRENRNIEFTQ